MNALESSVSRLADMLLNLGIELQREVDRRGHVGPSSVRQYL